MAETEHIFCGGLIVHDHPADSSADQSSAVSLVTSTRTQSPTFGQLGKRFADVHASSDSSDWSNELYSPSVYILELEGMVAAQPRSALPFVLAFTDLTYSIQKPQKLSFSRNNRLATAPSTGRLTPEAFSETKNLLSSISGEAREGEILAVLGASGSGKSTLIDALANRIARQSLHGSITLNGEKLDGALLKVISAYVMQDDLLYPMLTVEETLMFSAEFRLPRTLSAAKKKARVQALIDQLGLGSAANTVIGDEGHRGVSGGERRRVSIGIDIIHDPIILFLDEPTSGLDSTSAFMVVKVLQRIAQSGSIVIMSIHQPSYRILGILDRLIFLSHGQMAYNGPAASLGEFFTAFGHPVPDNENPAEFALDLISELEPTTDGTNPLVEFNRSRRQSWKLPLLAPDKPSLSLKEAIRGSISRGKMVSGATDGIVDGSGSSSLSKFANPFWVETAVLVKRSFINAKRMPELLAIRLVSFLVTGFILGTIFWRVDSTPKGVQERMGFFAISMSTIFFTCADALQVFLQDRCILLRETAYNAYRRSSYVIAHAVVGFPQFVLLSLAFASTTFFAVGLGGGAEGFVFFVLIILASFWSASGFVTFLSGVAKHIMIAYPLVAASLVYFIIFSGFFINRDRIHDYWIWLHYLSLVKYPYEAVMHNEFSDPAKCFVRGTQMFENTLIGSMPEAAKMKTLEVLSSSLGIDLTGNTCVMNGADILKQQSITQLSKWNGFWVTVAAGFFFRVLFYVSLLLDKRNKRR